MLHHERDICWGLGTILCPGHAAVIVTIAPYAVNNIAFPMHLESKGAAIEWIQEGRMEKIRD